MTAVELNKVAWEVVGRLQSSSCKPPSYIRCVDFEPEMVFVEGGTFTMGCTSCREEYSGPTTCRTHSKTTSSVTLSPFWIGKYELKQSEWNNALIAMDTTIQSVYFESVFGKEDDFPAYNIDYNAAQAFIAKLNEHTGKNYRLPTEAEWEYAARGGALSKGYEYSGSNTLDNVSWYSDNSKGKAHVVGTKDGNELGIYDMSGNVWEWCQDWYNDNLPSGTNPTAPRQRPPIYADDYYIIRGGSWYNVACNSHVAYRGYYRPGVQLIGIRLVLPSLP
jgi:formylglycine-generating enzyme required for sulfatase activity